MMEGLSARLACRTVTEKDLKELRKLNLKLKTYVNAKDIRNSMKTDIRFHEHVAKVSGNGRLLTLLKNSLLTNLFCLSQRSESFIEHGPETVAQHEMILECIEKHDESCAEKAMRDQIRQGGKWILLSNE